MQARGLLSEWATGESSGVHVQKRAQDHVDDHQGAAHPDMMRLAALGNHGICAKNLERDFWRFIVNHGWALDVETYMAHVPTLKKNGADTVKYKSQCMLLPHELFACLNECPPAQFHAALFPTGQSAADALSSWWRLHSAKPWAVGHPVPDRERGRCIPIALYGDSAPVGKSGEKLTILTWSSTLADRDAWRTRFLITAIPGKWALKGTTIEPIWTVVAWSLHVMQTGSWPRTDHQGRPWPAGSRRKTSCRHTPCAQGSMDSGTDTNQSRLGIPGGRIRMPALAEHPDVLSVYCGDLPPRAVERLP